MSRASEVNVRKKKNNKQLEQLTLKMRDNWICEINKQ